MLAMLKSGTMSLRLTVATVVWLFAAGTAFACACDIDCPKGEIFSDEQEMCVPDPAKPIS
ncbi:MAG: hypothetical protein AAFR04_02120 [Pseudomonadota bacterium]